MVRRASRRDLCPQAIGLDASTLAVARRLRYRGRLAGERVVPGGGLGGAPGFAVGAVAGLTSNFFFGQGPWTPWQMAAWGGVGIAGALLHRVTRGRLGRIPLAAACGLAGLAYGAVLNFSTWDGVHGVYLEDLYVRPGARGAGLGKALLTALAGECVRHGYTRLQWWVLNWNEPAIGFYTSLGAVPMDEWTVFRLTGDSIRELARSCSADL